MVRPRCTSGSITPCGRPRPPTIHGSNTRGHRLPGQLGTDEVDVGVYSPGCQDLPLAGYSFSSDPTYQVLIQRNGTNEKYPKISCGILYLEILWSYFTVMST